MTNSEYFEKNNVPFAKAMEIFNEQKSKNGGTKSFDKFLASEHHVFKFKVGDLVVLQLNKETIDGCWHHNVVFEIIGINEQIDLYDVKFLTSTAYSKIGDIQWLDVSFLERNAVLY